jgi:hypothetical protein
MFDAAELPLDQLDPVAVWGVSNIEFTRGCDRRAKRELAVLASTSGAHR